MAWTLKTYMVSRLLKARVQAGSVPGGERGAAAPLSGESEAMRYCASAIVSASSLYQSADCLM